MMRDFSSDEIKADVSPTVGDMARWLDNTKEECELCDGWDMLECVVEPKCKGDYNEKSELSDEV